MKITSLAVAAAALTAGALADVNVQPVSTITLTLVHVAGTLNTATMGIQDYTSTATSYSYNAATMTASTTAPSISTHSTNMAGAQAANILGAGAAGFAVLGYLL